MTALTREELLDIDPVGFLKDSPEHTPYKIALRHAWNWAVEAETCAHDGDSFAQDCAATSQAWSAIAEALK
jgi:hypothetical protein